tara:strand:+ start:219 stop:740 length:522 start_codon:yes stop_codon:yes gene_type:complete
MTIRSKRGDNVTPEEHKLVVRFAKQCLREICKKQYEVQIGVTYPRVRPLTYTDALDRIQVSTKYRNQRSYGGAKGISIDVRHYRESLTSFHEYKSFANDPVIGSITNCADSELLLKCLVAHEVSHHIQRRYGPFTRYLKKTCNKPHGDGFKTIYRELRRTLVNPYIEPVQEVA